MASPEPAAQPSLAATEQGGSPQLQLQQPVPEPAAQPSLAATEQGGSPQLQLQQPVPEAAAAVPEAEAEKVEGAEVEEEERECGFSLFMKAGGCKDAFLAWEEAAQKDGDDDVDMVERCHEATVNLMRCMDAHADYYVPVLRAEEVVSEFFAICAHKRVSVERVD